jgi:F-type H+-transporting ATPase subunit gamma
VTDRLADIAAQIHNVRQLESVVTAMRGIAASRTQQSRALLGGVATYSEVVSRAITRALSLVSADHQPSPGSRSKKRGLVLFCAEHGFAGAFSARVFDVTGAEIKTAAIFLVGTRGTILAEERGITPVWSAAMATNTTGIPALAHRITEAIDEQIALGITDIDIVYPRYASQAVISIEHRSLFPVELGRFASAGDGDPPIVTLEPALLVERLAEEYVFARLCEAATFSFEAENEARMVAMSSAKTNIETRLDDLLQRERQLRQEAVTDEVIELAAGTEAFRQTAPQE